MIEKSTEYRRIVVAQHLGTDVSCIDGQITTIAADSICVLCNPLELDLP
jgi:hypothetical protein